MEGVLLTIQRDGSPYGEFLIKHTIFHHDIPHYRDVHNSPSNLVQIKSGNWDGDTEFVGGQPLVYVEAEGHGIEGAERWEKNGGLAEVNFPGGDGVVYYYTGTAEEPADGDDRDVGYDLLSMQELWDRRCDFEDTFAGFGRFAGDDHAENAANAPWGWGNFHDFGAPFFFLNPGQVIDTAFNNKGPFHPLAYIDSSYQPGPPEVAADDCTPVDLGSGFSVVFTDLQTAGNTTATSGTTGSPPPAGFQLGSPALYFDVATAATFSGNVEVCTSYDEASFANERGVRLFHEEGSSWQDVTSVLAPDENRVCGLVDSLSPFLVAELAPGEDFDGDGCTNATELAENPFQGGHRDPEDVWDFFDVPTPPTLVRNKAINVGDIAGVVGRFGSFGNPMIDPLSAPPPSGYHPAFDRGATKGPLPWERDPANGSVTVADISAVVQQFGHACL
jgi:hypothetical protein